ncbi:MAG: class I SAM-dependent methyltransferase [Patescibacteria group bacterium]
MNLKETYNSIAEDWHKDHAQDDWWVHVTDKFISFLRAGDSVLDIGCGAGTKSKYLMEHGLRVTGIDFSEKMIEIAEREVPTGTFKVLDLNEVNKLEDSFDGIFMQAVLLHVPKKEAGECIRKAAERLRGGGFFYVGVKEIKPGRAEEEMVSENDYGYPYERFFSYYTKDEMESCFRDVDLEVVYSGVTSSGKTNWFQIIGKKYERHP